jgi:hypothetical protein
MKLDDLKANKILRGPIFPEPVQVIVTIPMGDAVKLVGKGINTGKVYEPMLTPEKLAELETSRGFPPSREARSSSVSPPVARKRSRGRAAEAW